MLSRSAAFVSRVMTWITKVPSSRAPIDTPTTPSSSMSAGAWRSMIVFTCSKVIPVVRLVSFSGFPLSPVSRSGVAQPVTARKRETRRRGVAPRDRAQFAFIFKQYILRAS